MCIWVHKGKILGCLVSTKGIEANPDKIAALCNMEEPQSIRDVQELTGRIAALNRFIPRSADRSLPFFKVLRSSQKFEWGDQQREAFNSLKEYLQQITKLTSPDPKETLLLYTSASQKAVSAALVVERDRWHSQATTRLLHIRSSSSFQVALFGTLKDILCSHHGLS